MTNSTYKFEGFNIGQIIIAQDFQPIGDRPEYYCEGEILAADTTCAELPYAYYIINVTADTDSDGQRRTEGGRVGQKVYVPMESDMDWDTRIRAKTTPLYTALTVKIQRPDGSIEEHDLSVGGYGSDQHSMERTQARLAAYAAGSTNTIKQISKCQLFLASAGYGLSNVILLEVSELFEVYA